MHSKDTRDQATLASLGMNVIICTILTTDRNIIPNRTNLGRIYGLASFEDSLDGSFKLRLPWQEIQKCLERIGHPPSRFHQLSLHVFARGLLQKQLGSTHEPLRVPEHEHHRGEDPFAHLPTLADGSQPTGRLDDCL